jgi:Bacterial regulatory proteins, luxR family
MVCFATTENFGYLVATTSLRNQYLLTCTCGAAGHMYQAAILGQMPQLDRFEMAGVDYYDLLKTGAQSVSDLEWEVVLKQIIYRGRTPRDVEAALGALENILFECSSEWVVKRARMVSRAAQATANPKLRSNYCLKALQDLADEADRKASQQADSSEIRVVHRQVADHLRRLSDKGVLVSETIRTRQRKSLCKIWGLVTWGEGWEKRIPERDLKWLPIHLPVIVSSTEGKGLFDYASILPNYVPMILREYGAPLSTARISSIVVCKITPPLKQNPVSLSSEDDEEALAKSYGSDWSAKTVTPEDLLAEKQVRESFLNNLTEREKNVLNMKEQGLQIEEIADRLECSKRTVNNNWRTILGKFEEVWR